MLSGIALCIASVRSDAGLRDLSFGLGGSFAIRTHSAHVGLSISGDHATRCGTLALHRALANLSFEADGMRCIRLSDTELTNQR
jgi:hypothetical protein